MPIFIRPEHNFSSFQFRSMCFNLLKAFIVDTITLFVFGLVSIAILPCDALGLGPFHCANFGYIVIATHLSKSGSFYYRLYINPPNNSRRVNHPFFSSLGILLTLFEHHTIRCFSKNQCSLMQSRRLSFSPPPLSKASAYTTTAIIFRQDLALYPSATSATSESPVLSAGQGSTLQT